MWQTHPVTWTDAAKSDTKTLAFALPLVCFSSSVRFSRKDAKIFLGMSPSSVQKQQQQRSSFPFELVVLCKELPAMQRVRGSAEGTAATRSARCHGLENCGTSRSTSRLWPCKQHAPEPTKPRRRHRQFPGWICPWEEQRRKPSCAAPNTLT